MLCFLSTPFELCFLNPDLSFLLEFELFKHLTVVLLCSGDALTLPRVQCPNHPDAILVEDYRAGDMICPECGLVVGDRVIDVGSEWRTFSNEKALKDPSRVGDAQNPLLNGGDLTTMISKGTGAASFDEFGNSKYQNRRTMSSSDRAMLNAFKEISTMADRINLPRNIIVSKKQNKLFFGTIVAKQSPKKLVLKDKLQSQTHYLCGCVPSICGPS